MSSSGSNSKGGSPEWKSNLNKTISENMKENKDAISYSFATLGPEGAPKVRYVLHRGFVNERRKEDDPSANPVGEEEEGKVGEALLSTTDVRAPKSQQLVKASDIEIAWWFANSGDQYRITGKAYVLGCPDHPTHKSFISSDGQRLAPPALRGAPGSDNAFSWEDERKRIYEKLSPAIRASFCRPIPGLPLKANDRTGDNAQEKEDYDPKDFPLELKLDGDKALLEKSYANFALVIIEPYCVDWCQLNEQPNRRVIYRKDKDWVGTPSAP